MKVDLNRTHSPCESCWIRGVPYDPESKRCMSCEFDITFKLLKKAFRVLGGSNCFLCKKYRTGCAATSDEECGYKIDWHEACKRFGIEIIGD